MLMIWKKVDLIVILILNTNFDIVSGNGNYSHSKFISGTSFEWNYSTLAYQISLFTIFFIRY